MGAIFKTGFDRAIDNGGLSALGNWRSGLTLDGSPNFTYDFSVTTDSNSNPNQKSDNAWFKSGSRLNGGGFQWGTWISDVSQTIGQCDVEVQDASGNWTSFLVIDGNDLPQSVNSGTEVTLEIGTSNGTADFIRPGLAEAVVNGIGSFTAYYVLMSGGSPIGDAGSTLAETDGNASSWVYDAGATKLKANGEVTFENGSGADWSVDAIEVRVSGEGGDIAFRDTVSATVADGGSITFTTIEQSINGLT